MSKKATIHRMVTPDHLCPWGVKAIDLLRRNGFEIEANHPERMDANEVYKEEHGYDETPQIWIEGDYIEKRDLNCACVGGGSSVPLGFISHRESHDDGHGDLDDGEGVLTRI